MPDNLPVIEYPPKGLIEAKQMRLEARKQRTRALSPDNVENALAALAAGAVDAADDWRMTVGAADSEDIAFRRKWHTPFRGKNYLRGLYWVGRASASPMFALGRGTMDMVRDRYYIEPPEQAKAAAEEKPMGIEVVTEEPEVLADRQKIGSLIKQLLRSNAADEMDVGDALTMTAPASGRALQQQYGLSPREAAHWEFIREHTRQAGGINNLRGTR